MELRYTWYSCDKKTKKVIDYVLTNKFVQQYITDCVVKPNIKVDSDHRVLVTSLRTPINKASRWKPKKKNHPRTDLNALQDVEMRANFISKSENNINWTNENITPSELSDKIIHAFQSAAVETLPKKRNAKHNGLWKDDQQLNELIDRRSSTLRGSEHFKVVSKLIKKRILKLRNQKIRNEADEINNFATKRKIEEMYRTFKNDSSSFKNGNIGQKCDPQKLTKFFADHFSPKKVLPTPKELTVAPVFHPPLSTNPQRVINTNAPTILELKNILKKLKGGKSANDIPPVFLKCALDSEEMIQELVKLYKLVWQTKEIPDKWGLSRLVALWKGASKGKITDPKAYRALQIGSTLCKILVIIILERLREWYDENLSDQQQGFRPGRGTTDGIYLVKRLQQISNLTKKPVYALFVDLTAAFDHINRDWLFTSIKQRFPNNQNNILFDLLQALYTNTKTALDGNLNDVFQTYVGVRQGGPESPFLYNLYMDYVLRVFLLECNKKNIKFTKLKYLIPANAVQDKQKHLLGSYGQFYLDWIGYADDLVIAFADIISLQRGLTLLDEIFTRFQLCINVSKTKTMIFSPPVGEYPTTICKLNDEPIENVETFRYLGSLIDHQIHLTGDLEINFRIDCAESKFYQHGKKFMNHSISLKTRVTLLNALVRSRLTYACQTWSLTARHSELLNATYNRMLRIMVRRGFRRKEDSWSFVLSNTELHRICGTDPLDDFIHRQQKSYIAHVIRKGDDSLTKRITFNDDAAHRRGRSTNLMKAVISRDGRSAHAFYEDCLSKKI